MDLILTVDNADDFSENFYVMLAMFVSCCKMFSLLRNRNNITMLIDILMKKPCRPTEHDEIKIRQKFDKIVLTNTLYYTTLVELTCAFALATSVFKDYRKHNLAFRAWLPFNYSSPMLFRIAYFHQSISLTAGSVLHLACDSLICGLLMHICSQLEILECRLKKTINKPHIFRECVIQHTCIFEFALITNEKFRLTITVQFLVSMLVVCFNLHQLTQTSVLSAKYVQIVLYMFCMLTQISFYCWYGNEVKLKSRQLVSNIFEMEWFVLDYRAQKDLSIIMMRSIIPIEFTSAYVIPMNLQSFVSLLKTSYSAFNILQQIILMICGCWIPDSCTTLCKRLVYHFYTILILLLIHTFMLSQLMDLILTVDNPDDFTDNFYMLLAMIVSCCKMFTLLMNRSNIAILIDILVRKPCKPIQSDEIKIQQKFDKHVQTNTLFYAVWVETTCLCIAVTSLLTEFRKGRLTFRAWLPFDYSSSSLFHIVYAHQLISLTAGSILHVACDGLICGLLVHVCCQIEIIECRLQKVAHDQDILRKSVLQHNHLFKFARLMNEKFRLTIVIQFVVSMLVVCVILYQFTKSTASRAQYMQLMMYMGCMLSQIFFYCWYGNEVMLKSRQLINSIFEMEWFELNKQTKQSLLMIMRRSSRPIELTSAYVISMNLDSFVGLLKTSYSAYNVLKQIKQQNQYKEEKFIIHNMILKMFILTFTFKILMICGCGRLDSWPTPYKRLVYHVYTIFVMLLIHTFMLSQLMDLIIIVDNSNDFTDNFYVLLAMIVSCCKMLALLMNRSNIEMLIKTLMRKPFRPVEPDEMKIRQKFEKLIQSNTLYYTILVETTCLSVAVTSLLTEFKKGNLTFRAWLPFDYSSSQLFPFVYAHQLISFTMGSVHHVACDSLICGFLVHICCQIEILEHRLRKSARDPNILRECVLQHNNIFKFARIVNEKFRITIFIQFVVSTLVMCFNLYQFTKSTALRTKYMQLIMYTCSMLSQIFFYCWYGNEVKLRSRQLINNIFEMEWFKFNETAQKTLLMVMRRAVVPIEFTSACVISMNLDSFVGLLKTSYSAYNILKQTQGS
ncbi:PREDICTED: uncharacterized protein LOC108689776 [Atta colombica]|uniref:uncharacterized protein LOC108689776 n=1 Tax=Atta colombica TaxID=520822 RepID=UPI00084C431D|nr:PREDICTED: uncharacterized protein LOC108689776 [Atta colombica]